MENMMEDTIKLELTKKQAMILEVTLLRRIGKLRKKDDHESQWTLEACEDLVLAISRAKGEEED